MSFPQSPSRQSQRSASRASHIQIPYATPVPQYPHHFPGSILGQNANLSSTGPIQHNPYQQQTSIPQGQPTSFSLPNPQAGYAAVPEQFSPPVMDQVAFSSSLSVSPRGPPTPYPQSVHNPSNNLRTPSEHSFSPQLHPATKQSSMASPRRATERASQVSATTLRERPTEESSAPVIEVYSPGTSRIQRREHDRAVSTSRRSNHRHEERQALARISGAESTPPAQYYGPVGTSNVNVYHMYKPTFVVQPKQEAKVVPKATPEAEKKKKKGFLTRVFESDPKK